MACNGYGRNAVASYANLNISTPQPPTISTPQHLTISTSK